MAITTKQLLLICVIALNVISIIIAIRKDVIHGATAWALGALLSLIIDYIPQICFDSKP